MFTAAVTSAHRDSGVGVTIHDITHADGTDVIAMEYVQGKTLGELIGRKGHGLKDTLTYAIQAAGALAKAHAVGIVHRDLKPSNIMVTDDGLGKILDFGVAKLTTSNALDGDQAASAPTMTGHDRLETTDGRIVGTAVYMSPEQAEGRKVDARSDIFSFGAVLYEMATGTRAFQGTRRSSPGRGQCRAEAAQPTYERPAARTGADHPAMPAERPGAPGPSHGRPRRRPRRTEKRPRCRAGAEATHAPADVVGGWSSTGTPAPSTRLAQDPHRQ